MCRTICSMESKHSICTIPELYHGDIACSGATGRDGRAGHGPIVTVKGLDVAHPHGPQGIAVIALLQPHERLRLSPVLAQYWTAILRAASTAEAPSLAKKEWPRSAGGDLR